MSADESGEKMERIKKVLKEKHGIDLTYQYDIDLGVYKFRKDNAAKVSKISTEYVEDFSEAEIVDKVLIAQEGDLVYEGLLATQSIVFPTSSTYDIAGMNISGTLAVDYHYCMLPESKSLFKKYGFDA